MAPNFNEGDFVLVARWPFIRYKTEQVIVAQIPHNPVAIKRIHISAPEGIFWLKGDNPDSVTTEAMGPIKARQILGKVIWHIKPREPLIKC